MNGSIRKLARPAALAGVSVVVLAFSLWASGTTAWEMTSYNDFVKGRFEGIERQLVITERAYPLHGLHHRFVAKLGEMLRIDFRQSKLARSSLGCLTDAASHKVR